MEPKLAAVITGALLHDIGKVLYRESDKRNHSESGYYFLKENIKISDEELRSDILEQVRYHHAKYLSGAKLKNGNNSLAYITYMADNIASDADRRKNEGDDKGFDININLSSIFNILNKNNKKAVYKKSTFKALKDEINFPCENNVMTESDDGIYCTIKVDIENLLKIKDIEYNEYYMNSLLSILEAYLSFIPSSTALDEIADISLYDHVKITAAVASCMYLYFRDNNITDYKSQVWGSAAKDFYKKEIMLLFSMDISGIQNFIYDIQSENALKNLRSRSFYLDILLEDIADDLLEELELSRANLLYSGGGHAYILIQNTEEARDIIEKFEKKTNEWFLRNFKNALYIAMAYTPCCCRDLSYKNYILDDKEESDYYGCGKLYRAVNEKLSQKKINRYSAEDIRILNSNTGDFERECAICRRSDKLIQDDKGRNICSICHSMITISRDIIKNEKKLLRVMSKNIDKDVNCDNLKKIKYESHMPLPHDKYLIIDDILEDGEQENIMAQDRGYIRSYIKNDFFTEHLVCSKLWIGDYTKYNTLEELAAAGKGIKRLAVLRADVDSLGSAISSGFEEKYNSLSRSTALSRNLSIFFKFYINHILEKPEFSLEGNEAVPQRNASVIYSGGDDLFIVGAWKDILEFSIDLYNTFKKFTLGALTFSAGYGIYDVKYPVSYMAYETGKLEEQSKENEGKNSITLFKTSNTAKTQNNGCGEFEENHTYKWDELISEVLGEKFKTLVDFFSGSEEKGASFLYRLLKLFREDKEGRINIARLAYLLGRIESELDMNSDETSRQKYGQFAEKIYKWRLDNKDRKQMITAVYIYAYLIRQNGA